MSNLDRSNRTCAPPTVKCLLVDDLEENLLSLSALLRYDNVELLQARSGQEALELLLEHDVALALIDVQMPDMDGFELAELIRGTERTRHIPLIFVTAGNRDEHRLFKGYEKGAVDFLYKPIEPVILRNKAEVFFQLYRQKQQLAQELHDRTETLRLNEMLVAMLGHDLRSPLTVILMAAKAMHRKSPDEATRGKMEQIISSGTRMGRMIMDILDLARARLAGGIPILSESTELGATILKVVEELQAAAPQRLINFDQVGDLNGTWDSARLAQVASNLIGNAIQHGDPDAPVQVRLDGSNADRIVFSVANAGHIPEEILPKLFDPFRGGERRKRDDSGLGLGLYIVHQIVVAHHGKIEVQSSAQEQRTHIVATLPRHSPSSS